MTDLAAADRATPGTTTGSTDLEGLLEQHRVELTAYCYRMLGSAFEAEDAVQETMVRAWRSFDRFEGRVGAALLALPHRHQRLPRHAERPPAAGAADGPGPAVQPPTRRSARRCPRRPGSQPVPDGRVLAGGDPAELAVARETIRLAFVAALQHLPPRQRAVLILREVLRWEASEVAELLDTTRRLGQQRAAARPRHARRPASCSRATRSTPLDTSRAASCSTATSTRSSATTWTR